VWSPERRFIDGQTPMKEHKVVSQRGEKLVPYRIHEPDSHSQYLAQGLYEKFKLVEEYTEINGPPKRDMQAHRLAAKATMPAALLLMPDYFSLDAASIAHEAESAQVTKEEAAASMILGRDLMKKLTRSEEPEVLELVKQLRVQGRLDVKAWIRLGSAAHAYRSSLKKGLELSDFVKNLPMVEKVLITLAILYNVEKVATVDISGMGLEKVPMALSAYTGLRSLNMSQNRPLRNLTGLPSTLQAIDLFGCLHLEDVQPLGAISDLKAVDLSCCESLTDVAPLLSAGYLRQKKAEQHKDEQQGAVTSPSGKKVLVESPPPSPLPASFRRGAPISAREQVGDGMAASMRRSSQSVEAPRAAEFSRPKSAGSGAMTERLERDGNKRLLPQDVVPLGHPKLRWLCLSGCNGVQHGLDLIPKCEALSFVDLFGCESADPGKCADAAEGIQTFVWPSVGMLGEHAQAAGFSRERLTDQLLSACAAVEEKQRLAVGDSRQEELPPKTKQAEKAAVQAAEDSAADLGLWSDQDPTAKMEKPLFAEIAEAWDEPEVAPQTGKLWGKLKSMERRLSIKQMAARTVTARGITPLSFSKGLHDIGYKAGKGLQLTHIFRVIDADRDGLVQLEDLQAFESSPAQMNEVILAVGTLLSRHHGAYDAVAANLAANRKDIDRSRIRECMVTAGVDEHIAAMSAQAIGYCAKNVRHAGEGVKEALTHGLSGFAIAHAASLVEEFKSSLQERFGADCREAFPTFDINGSGTVTWEEFTRSVLELWPRWKEPGALEVLFRVLNRRGNRLLEPRDFEVLNGFNAERTCDAMEHAGRGIIKFPYERHDRLVRMDLDASVSQEDKKGMSRTTFCDCWEEMRSTDGVDGKMVFSLLDSNSDNRIYRRQMLILTDAMPRMGEVAEIAGMVRFLKNKYGSLQVAAENLQKASQAISGKDEKPGKDKKRSGGAK